VDALAPLLSLLLSFRRRRWWKAQAPIRRAAPNATAYDGFVGAENAIVFPIELQPKKIDTVRGW